MNIKKIPVEKHYLVRALCFTIGALSLYIPTNLYPFMTMRHMGQYKSSTIWDGIVALYDSGSWTTATIVFMASIIIPMFKLIALLFIICCDLFHIKFYEQKNIRNSLLALIEYIGRWSMLDIFLVAIMVAVIKFDNFATVTAEIATFLLACVVILTMLASASLTQFYKEDY